MPGDSPPPRPVTRRPAARRIRLGRLHAPPWALFVALLLVAVGAGAAIALAQRQRPSSTSAAQAAAPLGPVARWAAGTRAASDFRLHDENGRPVSLRAFRGRVVVLTFLDPLCRTFCPLEAKVLSRLERAAPPATRPTIVAVSVDPLGDRRATLVAARRKWGVDTRWHWAVGRAAALASVWRRYQIEVKPVKGDVLHTEGAYVIDRDGDVRAFFLWPFSAADVERVSSRL